MENRTTKKLFAGILALSGAFILASCDPISATPKNYNDAIVSTINEQGDVIGEVGLNDNKMGTIYDSIATDRNEKIISDLLDEVAHKKFGTYYDIKKAASDMGEDDPVEMKKYIDNHTDVFKRDRDNQADKHAGATPAQIQKDRFETFWNDIQDRISESLWNEINSGSYNDKEGRFDESKLWMAHYFEFYDISGKSAAQKNQFFVTNNYDKYHVLRDGYLKGTYDVYELQDEWSKQSEEEKKNNPFTLRGYIEEKVFPQIIKDKLVEEYIFNNNYSALGRAYARKVNYLKISYKDHVIPWAMLKNFADKHIESYENEFDFEIVTKATKGFEKVGNFTDKEGDQGIFALEADSDAYLLLSETLECDLYTSHDRKLGIEVKEDYKLGNVVLVPKGWYYKNTKLGEILVSYEKACNAEKMGRFPIESEKQELDKFTVDGKAKEYGLRDQLIALGKEDYTTDGWFVKNGGLSELPAALRDRLFNINVANSLDDGSCVLEDNTPEHPMGGYEKGDTNRSPYMRNIFGRKFVVPANSQRFSENKYSYIYQDKSGNAFYIVQVLEAPSTPKLNYDSETSYTVLPDTSGEAFKTETIARAVSKVLGTKDSYIKDAYTKALEPYKNNFVFYETSLYEHFKSEYPDLFDDED